MGPRANSLRNIPAKGTSTFAGASARESSETPATPKSIALDLKPLIQPYRDRGRLTLRLEKLPQSARLSAGQNNGDRTWSLAQDELEGLCYFPPAGADEEHVLAVRLIAKDETGASTIALLEVRVPLDGTGDAAPPLRLARKPGQAEPPQDSALRDEIAQLKSTLAEREAELKQTRASGEQAEAQAQEKIDAALWAAENIWKAEEAARLNVLRTELEDQAEKERRSQNAARAQREQDAAALQQLQDRYAQAQKALGGHEAEAKRLQAQFEQLRQERDAARSAAKAAGDAKSAAQAEQTQRAAQTLAELTARCEAAEEALIAERAASQADQHEAEQRLQTGLAALQRQTEDIAAAKAAGEAMAAEKLKAAQVQWQQQTAKALAEIAGRCEAAERALASLRAAKADDNQDAARQARDQAELERLRREGGESAAAMAAAERLAEEKLTAAQALWQQQTGMALAELTARCEAAEAQLVAARAAPEAVIPSASGNRDAEITQLQAELKRWQRTADELSVAKAAGDLVAAEQLKTAQGLWQQQSAKALAELTARCETAEAALASARSADSKESDAYIRSLNREIKTLQAALVDREAVLASTQASLEQLRYGAEAKSPAAHWQPLPGGSRLRVGDEVEQAPSNHLLRDAAILVLTVIIAVLAFPRIEALLPDDVRWQIETVGGLFGGTSTETIPVAAAPVPHAPPKAEHLATVTRGVNLRDQPSVNGALVANLKRGAQVTILEARGNWDRVTFTGTDQKVQQGWVYNSYVQDGGPTQP